MVADAEMARLRILRTALPVCVGYNYMTKYFIQLTTNKDIQHNYITREKLSDSMKAKSSWDVFISTEVTKPQIKSWTIFIFKIHII